MHIHTLEKWQHSHDFSVKNDRGEHRTQYVLLLTAITMVVEIIAGSIYGSMALLADGWHMSTHVAAFMITLFAYRFARKHANNPAYAFGTGKVNVLGGLASAIALAVVALVMLVLLMPLAWGWANVPQATEMAGRENRLRHQPRHQPRHRLPSIALDAKNQ